MSMEGPPMPPEKKEKEPITDAECLEAMKMKDFEKVSEWYKQQEVIADQDPTGKGRVTLTIELGSMQKEAGFIDEARETFEAALMDASGQRDDVYVKFIQERLDEF